MSPTRLPPRSITHPLIYHVTHVRHTLTHFILSLATISLPKRYNIPEKYENPYSLAEVERNLTLYLHTLHERLAALAGPKVHAEIVWETFLGNSFTHSFIYFLNYLLTH